MKTLDIVAGIVCLGLPILITHGLLRLSEPSAVAIDTIAALVLWVAYYVFIRAHLDE
jgi:drug/metabolite transporter (DMT)-like permease